MRSQPFDLEWFPQKNGERKNKIKKYDSYDAGFCIQQTNAKLPIQLCLYMQIMTKELAESMQEHILGAHKDSFK